MTYAIYNIGAAVTALAMEFFLLRLVGLRVATLVLASLNAVVALGLLSLGSRLIPQQPAPGDRIRFSGRTLGALALASVASAVFQLLMIKIAECILGPFNETFALVLSTVLIGLSVGSWIVLRFKLTFGGALWIALGGTAALLALIPVWVSVYAALHPWAVSQLATLALLKLGLVLLLMGLPAVGFGATIPALLHEHRNVARESGQLLWVSSMANVAGFVLMAFVLHQHLSYGQLLMLIVAVTAAAVVLHAGAWSLRTALAGGGLIVALVLHGGLWDEHLLYYGHKRFHSPQAFEQSRRQHFSAEQFKGHHDLFAIIERDGRPFFFINGYISIALTAASEKIVGALSAMFAPRLDQALVLGVGSGATAGTAGLLFEHTDAVEINATVLANQHRMVQHNFDILSQPRLELIHDDGIHYIKTTPKKYSLILNTVTSPLYFSSSKLYTKDFYEAVRERLQPDGVYTTWIDREIGDRGVDIILNTLDSVFAECALTYIKSSYYLMVCSGEELVPRQLAAVQGNETLGDYLAVRHGLSLESVAYSILSLDAFRFTGQQTAVNRLDHPILEYHMAQLDGESRLFRMTERLIERTALRAVQRSLAPGFDWDPGGFALWADLRLSGSSLLAGAIDEMVQRQFGDVTGQYERAAQAFAARAGTAEAYENSGRELYDRALYGSAAVAFDAALALDATLYRSHYYLGRCHERAGRGAKAAHEFQRTLELRPDYDKAEQALDRVRGHAAAG
jgi:predicted membrane-bound spermidine synthase